MIKSKLKVYALLVASLLVLTCKEKELAAPFHVANLFDSNQPNTLGLTEAKNKETVTIFSPTENENKYNHGVVLFPFKHMLYAQWQSSSVDEDGEDTQVFYSRSYDGKVWSKLLH